MRYHLSSGGAVRQPQHRRRLEPSASRPAGPVLLDSPRRIHEYAVQVKQQSRRGKASEPVPCAPRGTTRIRSHTYDFTAICALPMGPLQLTHFIEPDTTKGSPSRCTRSSGSRSSRPTDAAAQRQHRPARPQERPRLLRLHAPRIDVVGGGLNRYRRHEGEHDAGVCRRTTGRAHGDGRRCLARRLVADRLCTGDLRQPVSR